MDDEIKKILDDICSRITALEQSALKRRRMCKQDGKYSDCKRELIVWLGAQPEYKTNYCKVYAYFKGRYGWCKKTSIRNLQDVLASNFFVNMLESKKGNGRTMFVCLTGFGISNWGGLKCLI